MNPDAVLRKTEKGQQEIDTRQFKLAGRLRAVLFMIDGQRTVAELLSQAGSLAEQLEGQLRELTEQGFIAAEVEAVEEAPEPVEVEVARAAPVAQEPVTAPLPTPAPKTQPAPAVARPTAAPAPVRPPVPLDVLKARLSKLVNDTLGMRAVFHAPQIAGISTHKELEAVIDEIARAMSTSTSAAAATRWRADARATVGLSA